MPQRIQRRRTKGFNLQAASSNPNGVVCVDRSTQYGNPFKIGHRYVAGDSFLKHYGQYLDDGLVTEENCLIAFEAYCRNCLAQYPYWLEPLRDKDLACFCPLSRPCHVDVIFQLLGEK